jgi:uncharacterized protein
MPTILLLIASNCFMTMAWYGHLKVKDRSLIAIILVSWLIALPEYCLAVPANRLGSQQLGGLFSAPQLKILQEGISVLIFLGFSLCYLREPLRWQDVLALMLILGGLAVALLSRSPAAGSP